MKKQIISAVAAIVFLAALTGCSDVNTIDNSTAETTSETEVSESTTEETTTKIQQATETSESVVPVSFVTFSQEALTVVINQSTTAGMTVTPPEAVSSLIWESTDPSIAVVDSNGNIRGISEGSCTVTVKDKTNPEKSASLYVTVKTQADQEMVSHSTNGVYQLTYIKGILVANKSYPLPSDYDPNVNEEAKNAFNEMQKAAFAEGLNIYISNGYRSYSTEKSIYDGYVAKDGKLVADTYAERPGYSEHQTGLAFDLNTMDAAFGTTPEGKWVAENCYKYGFIIRYPQGKESITGYCYQPWHIRYLGPNIASSVYQSKLCLEEFLEIDSKYEDSPTAAPINPALAGTAVTTTATSVSAQETSAASTSVTENSESSESETTGE